MSTEALKARHGVVLRADPGVLLTAADRPLPLIDLGGHRRAIIHIMQEANLVCAGGEEVRFILETAYGEGPFADSGELLTADIDTHQRTIGVDDTTTFVPGDVIEVDIEKMLVTASDGAAPGDLTVVRAYRSSARATHLNNAVVNLLDVDWVQVAVVMYDNADNGSAPPAVIVIGSTDIAPIIVDDLDVALADNTILALPLGDRLRLRTTIVNTPSYRYSARASFQN